MTVKGELQRVPGRCWGRTPYGYQCGAASTHALRRDGVTMWACGHHVVQVADSVAAESGGTTVIISAVRWHKS